MSIYQKLFFPNPTPSCICSMCLYCIGNISNCSIKSCARSWSAQEGTIYAYTKALLGKNCLCFNSCHFVKIYFFQTKLLHAYVQCIYIVAAKYQIAPSKAVVGVDRPIKALSIHIQKSYKRKLCKFSFCQLFLQPDSYMHMFNVSILYRQSIKWFHQKLW